MLLAEANQRSELGDGVPVDESSQFTTPNSSILWKNPPKWHQTDQAYRCVPCSSGPLERQDRYGTGFFSWRSKPAQAPEAPDHGISWDIMGSGLHKGLCQLDTDSFGMLLSHESIPEARLAGIAERIPRNKVGILADEGS